jgi:hypothetical protein
MWRETERLKTLISTFEASHREQQGCEEIAADAKARCAKAEMTASKLRADLAAATDRVRNVQEQLDDHIELASGKNILTQSIAEESLMAHTRLKCAEDRITLLDAKLLDEQLRRLFETKKLLDELIMAQDRHEGELRRLSQEALDTLRDAPVQLRQPPSDHDHYQLPTTTWPYDTGQPPLPPEHILDTSTLPVSSFIDPNSSFCSTQWSPHIPSQYQDSSTRQAALPINSSINANSSFCSTQWSPHLPSQDRDSSTRLAARLLGCWDQESEVDEDQRAALEELIELMCRVEPPGVQDVKPSEQDETRLREELIVTKEQLRLTEEEACDVRRELDQSKETLRDVEIHAMALEYELDICQATLREAQDAQQAGEAELVEVVQPLHLRQAESESSMARAEALEFKCSQVKFLCAALQERVTGLELQVKNLKSTQKCSAIIAAHTNSRSICPTDTCTGRDAPDLPCLVCSYTPVPLDPGIQDSGSIYMAVLSSMPRLLDSSLPPSLPPGDSSLYLSYPKCPAILSACADSHSLCSTDTGTLAPVLRHSCMLTYLSAVRA